jgi:hypothetical protein
VKAPLGVRSAAPGRRPAPGHDVSGPEDLVGASTATTASNGRARRRRTTTAG